MFSNSESPSIQIKMEAVDTLFRLCYNPITDYPVCFLRFIKQTLNYEVT